MELEEVDIRAERDVESFPTFGVAIPFQVPSRPMYTISLKTYNPPPGILQEVAQMTRGRKLWAYFMIKPDQEPGVVTSGFVEKIRLNASAVDTLRKTTKTSTRKKSGRASTARARRSKRHR